MICPRCEFPQLQPFPAEINIHFPGWKGLNKPTVWVFPQLLVCLNCGLTQFSLSQSELQRLGGEDLDDTLPQAAD